MNYRRRPFLCTTLYRNPMQASNFGGTFDQLFLWIFLWNFHRICVSAFSIPWCKKVKNDQKLKSRGSCLKAGPPPPPAPWFEFLVIFDFFAHGIKRSREACSVKISLKNSKGKLVKCATEVARLHKVSIQSCTQNRPSPKVQSCSGDWIYLFIAWTIFMKFGTLVHHVYGYKVLPQIF